MSAVLLTLLLCPGQIIVAADNSSPEWQERAQFHCRDEADDAVVIQRAADRAKGGERLVFAAGRYRCQSGVVIGPDVCGIEAAGRVWIQRAGNYDGWLMTVRGLLRCRIKGLSFIGSHKAKGLFIDNCHCCVVERIFCYSTPQALVVESGWLMQLLHIRAEDCRYTGPLIKLQAVPQLRHLSVVRCTGDGPILELLAGNAEHLAIEKCECGSGPVVRWSTSLGTLDKLHFEQNRAAVQVELTDCRLCRVDNVSLGGPKNVPVEVGILLKNCRSTDVGSVVATWCTDAIVRFEPDLRDCRADPERVQLYRDRDWYPPEWLPKHLIDHAGQGAR